MRLFGKAGPSCLSDSDKCPICLNALSDAAQSSSCAHKFCFLCLREWATLKPICPLCKAPFTAIKHGPDLAQEWAVPAAAPSDRDVARRSGLPVPIEQTTTEEDTGLGTISRGREHKRSACL